MSTSTDPIETIVELLAGTDDWPSGTKPDPIEEQWVNDLRTKTNCSGVAAYVWSSGPADLEQRGAGFDDVVQTEVVSVAVWASDAPGLVSDVAGDVIAILEDYAVDLRESTAWVSIRPTTVDDRRAEAIARRADHHVQVVEVELVRDGSPGTPDEFGDGLFGDGTFGYS